ncbi:D-alanyl-D-alanine carboxypeptidase family protein [Companilactobacillus keshanensis]|uniref:D-alanyl-D-alanine carboxypeptidase family protein n=1 Tax=Companilactobacillus keshanensis TaxID=2486003 RepID=A0ABW4BSI7_9LACO|nr:D-alanyl-D-alanine carboxypeptidase family protein [Companilactobacillus keshanensis]
MNKFFKKFLIVLSVLIVMFPIINLQTIQAEDDPEVNASAAMAFDANTGQIIYSKNAEKKVAIGSITKIITLYLVTQAIKDGKIKESDQLTPTTEQSEMTQDDELTNVRLDTDKAYTVKDLYDAAWIVSSNSAAMMLAQKVSGDQASFVKLMRKTLKSWGIKDAEINNVSGLNNSDLKEGMYLGNSDAENKLSVNDIAIVTKHILNKYPEILKTTSQQKLTFPEGSETKTYPSLDLLLDGARDYQEGYEFDGLKTGTTKQAGDSFVGTLPMGNSRIVTIVMNASGDDSDQDKRFRTTQALAKYVKDNFTNKKVLSEGQTVTDGNKKYKNKNDVYMWLSKDFNENSLSYNVSKTDLGFKVKADKKTVKMIATNTPGGYLPYPKEQVVIKKIKKVQKSFWHQITEFFENLF